MFPAHFADLLKQWLTDAQHPGIAQARTCAEIGRHEQPIGVAVTLRDGWTFVLQAVRTSPPSGDRDRPSPMPELEADHPTCRQRRGAFTAEQKRWTHVKNAKPEAGVSQLLAVLVDAVKQADHDSIADAEVSARDDKAPRVLRVQAVDGSTLYGLPVGFIGPSAVEYTHAAHSIPREWR